MHSKYNIVRHSRVGGNPIARGLRVKPAMTIAFFILSTLQIHAQRPQTELQIYTNTGIPITLESGVSSSGFDGNAGVGITAFLTRNIGVHLGIGVGTMRRETTVDKLQTVTHGLIDANNYTFDLYSTFSDYRENLRIARYFAIPLMLHFESGAPGFYTKNGAKFFLPMKDSRVNYDVHVATLQNAGYYPELDNWAKTQLFAGFGTFSDNRASNDFAFQFSTALALEVGWKWNISQNMCFYTGIFVDYWLNDFTKEHRRTPSDFSLPENLTTTEMINLELFQYANKINPTTVGIALRLAFKPSDKSRASAHHRALPCPPAQMQNRRPWDKPSLVFNHPTK